MGNRCHPLFVQPEQKNTSMKTNAITSWLALATLTSLTLQPLPSLGQATAFTYQGRLLDNGTNFTGTGQFEFAVVTSTNANHQATATADAPSGGYIIGYNVVSGGSGYANPPVVTVSGGGGAGAAAIAHVSGGVVTSITVYSGNFGNGNYTSAPTVTVAPPPPNFSYTTFWSNDGTSITGSPPASAVSVAVTNGLFTVVLGDTTVANMMAITASLFTQPNLQLQIWFNDGVNGFAALSPVQSLTPAPYAVQAMNANSTSNLLGSLPSSQLSGAIANGQLAYNSITVSAGGGLSGGGTVALGSSTILNNAGVLSVTGDANITANTVAGAVTLTDNSTSTSSGNTIVSRDASASFSANNITVYGTLGFPDGASMTSGGYRFLYSGNNNLFLGFDAGATTTGAANLAIGPYALNINTSGGGNTAIGGSALQNCTSGNNNIALGSGAAANLSTGNYNIDIGSPGFTGDNGAIRIGYGIYQSSAYINGIYGTTVSGVAVQVNSSGQLGVASSSRKFKQDIKNMADTSDELLSLRPVTFKYKPEIEPQGLPQFGLIAEEVERVDPNLVVHDKEHGIYTVRYDAVNVMLLNEFLKEHNAVENENKEIKRLQQTVTELKDIVNKLTTNQKKTE